MILSILAKFDSVEFCLYTYIISILFCLSLLCLVSLRRANDLEEDKLEVMFKYAFFPICNTLLTGIFILYLIYDVIKFTLNLLLDIFIWCWTFGPFRFTSKFITDLTYFFRK